MTCSEPLRLKVRSVGPAAALALAMAGPGLRVHSVFPSALNLEVPGAPWLVTVTGPAGRDQPQAVALEDTADFTTWGLAAGDPQEVANGDLRLRGAGHERILPLTGAPHPPRRTLPSITRLGETHRTCVAALAARQARAGCELNIGELGTQAASSGPGSDLRLAVGLLGPAAQAWLQTPRTAPLGRAVAALVGLGPGLTPAGDDFLAGFLAAARARGHGRDGLLWALHGAVEANLGGTGQISASMLRCAMGNFWPGALVDLASGLEWARNAEALRALAEMCALGHSSGMDLATGFFFGLEALGG